MVDCLADGDLRSSGIVKESIRMRRMNMMTKLKALLMRLQEIHLNEAE